MLVAAEGLVKAYGGRRALDGVDVEVPPGVLACITGPSGSGKTTLLHVLSGIAAPDAGTVRVAGRDLAGLDEPARAAVRRESMGFVFQRLGLLPSMSVAENVALPLLLQGAPAAEVRVRVGALLERVGLVGRGGDRPSQLSGGQAQRVAVARAVSTRPAVVWADEPTGALDSAAAEDVLGLLRELVEEEGATVVVVTHDPEVAARADVVVGLRDGRRTG